MKKSIFYTSSFGDFKGGGQRSLFIILEQLNREKYDPVLSCPTGGTLIEAAQKKNIPTEVIPLQSIRSLRLGRISSSFKNLKKALIKYKTDLIHTESPIATFYLGRLAKELRIPLIFHSRVSTPEPYLYERLIYNLSTNVIAVSETAKERFRKFRQYEDKVKVIHNAVAPDLFRPENDGDSFRREMKIGPDTVVIGLIGAISPHKGQEDLIRAASEVLKFNQNVRFLIVGEDENGHQRRLEKLAGDLALGDKVSFIPFSKNIPQVMAALDILVNASKIQLEGLSRVILEAMACGKPVVASDCGGNKDAVIDGETGLLVPPNAPDSLAKSLTVLINDKNKRERMGINARALVLKKFTAQMNVERIEELYSKVIAAYGDKKVIAT